MCIVIPIKKPIPAWQTIASFNALVNRGKILLRKKKYNDAIAILAKAISFYFDNRIMSPASLLTEALVHQAVAFRHERNFTAALCNYEEAYKYLEGDVGRQAQVKIQEAWLHFGTRQLDVARRRLDQAERLVCTNRLPGIPSSSRRRGMVSENAAMAMLKIINDGRRTIEFVGNHRHLGLRLYASKEEVQNSFRKFVAKYKPDDIQDAQSFDKFWRAKQAFESLTGYRVHPVQEHFWKGKHWMNDGRYRSAIIEFTLAHCTFERMGCTDPHVLVCIFAHRALAYHAIGHFEEAISDGEKALIQTPGKETLRLQAHVTSTLANAHLRLGQAAKATTLYARASRLTIEAWRSSKTLGMDVRLLCLFGHAMQGKRRARLSMNLETLGLKLGASESDVEKAFHDINLRRRESNCSQETGIQEYSSIERAYEALTGKHTKELLLKGHLLKRDKEFVASKTILDQAVHRYVFDGTIASTLLARVLAERASVNFVSDDFSATLADCKRALELDLLEDNAHLGASIAYTLARVFHKMGLVERACIQYGKSLALAKEPIKIFGVVNPKLDEFDKDRANEIIVHANKHRQSVMRIAELLDNLTRWKHGRQYELACEAITETIREDVGQAYPSIKGLLLAKRASVHLCSGSFGAASQDCKEARVYLLDGNNTDILAALGCIGGKAFLALGLFKDAYEYFVAALKYANNARFKQITGGFTVPNEDQVKEIIVAANIGTLKAGRRLDSQSARKTGTSTKTL